MGVVRPLRAGVATLATAGLAIGGSQMFISQAQASQNSVTARVSARTAVNIRAQAKPGSTILGVLDRGQQLNQIGLPVNGWVPVSYRGKTGYIDRHYLSSVVLRSSASSSSSSSASQSSVGIAQATTYVNVRAGHSVNSAKVGLLSPGQKVSLTGQTSQGFSQVVYNGAHRWVASRYLSTSGGTTSAKKTQTKTVYTTANLNLRKGSSTSAAIYTTAPKGTALTTTGRTTSGWTQITYKGHTLWASNQYLSTSKATSSAKKTHTKTVYTTANLNLRKGSSTSAAIYTTAPKGTALTTTGRTTSGWTQITYKGHTLWASNQYLSTSKARSNTASTGSLKSIPNSWSRLIKGDSQGLIGLRPSSVRIVNDVVRHFPQISTIYGVRSDPYPDHPSGHAVDLMLPHYKSNQDLGYKIANYYKAHADELGVQYIIFHQKIWNVSRDSEGWRPMEDRGGDTANHMDHVHITSISD